MCIGTCQLAALVCSVSLTQRAQVHSDHRAMSLEHELFHFGFVGARDRALIVVAFLNHNGFREARDLAGAPPFETIEGCDVLTDTELPSLNYVAGCFAFILSWP